MNLTPAFLIEADVQERQFQLKHKGKILNLVMREMAGDGSDEWDNFMASKATEKVPNNNMYKPTILSKCLFNRDTNQPLSAELIQSFSATAIAALFQLALELHGRTVEALEAAKKPLPATSSSGSESPVT